MVDRTDNLHADAARPITAPQGGGASAITRPAYLMLGWLCVGAGAVGVVLPVMPTTIFLLGALWAFSRSSPRFGSWIRNHPVFGPYVRDWDLYHAIPTHAKVLAVSMMSVSFAWLLFFTEIPAFALIATGLVMLGAAGYVVTRPAPPTAALSRQRVDRADKLPTA